MKQTPTLRAATLFHDSALRLDPARLTSPAARGLSLNLFGRLIEIDAEGRLEPGLALSFAWRGDTLVLHFPPPDAVGPVVDARAAAWSIKRSLKRSSPLVRASLDVLCPEADLDLPDAECAGVVVVGRNLELTPIRSDLRAQMARALTRPEFGVVHPAGCNAAGDIINLAATTGAYRVAVDQADGSWRLISRLPRGDGGPDQVDLVPIQPGAGTGQDQSITFATGEVADAFTAHPHDQVHQTIPLRVRALVWSAHARAHLSREERVRRGERVRASLAHAPDRFLNDQAQEPELTLVEFTRSAAGDPVANADEVIHRLFHFESEDQWLGPNSPGDTPGRAARRARWRREFARVVNEGSVIPFDTRPYRTLARPPWHFRASPFTTDVEFRHVRTAR